MEELLHSHYRSEAHSAAVCSVEVRGVAGKTVVAVVVVVVVEAASVEVAAIFS